MAAVEAARAAAATMSDAAAVGSAAVTLLDVLDGKAGGKPKVVAERTGTLAAAAALADAACGSGDALAGEAQLVVQRLCSFYATESSEEVPRAFFCPNSLICSRTGHLRGSVNVTIGGFAGVCHDEQGL